uniref:Uncharacterized protein n=1 Tax=Tanacetum cinerariifolium TaxID=118510 RepID=A0A699GT12_TANCI|nr:hypothetical protein [Tanacetum cinerariifolium]
MPGFNSIVRAFASLRHDLGNVEDKILVPKPPKNCARCTRCGYLVDGPNCQGCAIVRQELEENLVTHSPDFQNSFEPSNASTNVLNAPREPYAVKQDHGSFVDKIIFDLNRAPDSPNQFHCFHCKDVLRDGEAYVIFCKRCTCKSCGKDAHVGYNFPSKVPVISNPEPYNNQTIDELQQTLPIFHPTFHYKAESPCTLDSTPTYVDESPNVFNPPPQPPVYPCEFCGNDAYYGHYSTPQAPFIYPEQCYNQDFSFPQDFQIHNNILVVMIVGLLMMLTNQYTVDHPIFNAPNDYLDSQIQLNSTLSKINDQMTSITSLCEMACQVVQKKLEEKQLEEERAAKAKYWKLFVCYDDDDDEERSDSLDDNIIFRHPPFSAITPDEPVLSTEEPDNSLSMRDEHLNTILATESDEFIKSSVENLIPIPSESEGIPEHMCNVPFHDNSPPLDISKDQLEDFFESNEEFSSTDDDSFSVEASPPDSELVNSETKSSSTSLNSLLKETHTFDNSLPEFTTFLKVLFDAKYESDSSDDQSCSDEDVLEKIVSKPLSEEEIIPMKSLRTHDSSLPISSKIDSLLDEFAGELTLLKSISPGIDGTDCDFEEDVRLIEKLLYVYKLLKVKMH